MNAALVAMTTRCGSVIMKPTRRQLFTATWQVLGLMFTCVYTLMTIQVVMAHGTTSVLMLTLLAGLALQGMITLMTNLLVITAKKFQQAGKMTAKKIVQMVQTRTTAVPAIRVGLVPRDLLAHTNPEKSPHVIQADACTSITLFSHLTGPLAVRQILRPLTNF